MKKESVRKLKLNKKTINRLTESEAKAVAGGILAVTGACGSDFTRPMYTLGCAPLITAACGSDFTRPITIVTGP
jgi:hypothetical protein